MLLSWLQSTGRWKSPFPQSWPVSLRLRTPSHLSLRLQTKGPSPLTTSLQTGRPIIELGALWTARPSVGFCLHSFHVRTKHKHTPDILYTPTYISERSCSAWRISLFVDCGGLHIRAQQDPRLYMYTEAYTAHTDMLKVKCSPERDQSAALPDTCQRGARGLALIWTRSVSVRVSPRGKSLRY